MSDTISSNTIQAFGVPDVVWHFNDCRADGDLSQKATHWYFSLGNFWVAVNAADEPLDAWWDGSGFDIPEEVRERFLRKEITDIPTSGTLSWHDQHGRTYQLVRP